MPANRFNPGLSPIWIKEQRELGHAMLVSEWRGNNDLYHVTKKPKISEGEFAVAIVDEAHALIDPTAPGAEGVPPSGWAMHAGTAGLSCDAMLGRIDLPYGFGTKLS